MGATDHASFDSAGIPGFQFMQERLGYNSRTHHSNMDFVDRVQREDLVQQAAVAAVFAWYTAELAARSFRGSACRPHSLALRSTRGTAQ